MFDFLDGPAHVPTPSPPSTGMDLWNAAVDATTTAVGSIGHRIADVATHEGVGALADPIGAFDRSDARDELAGRFDVVGDKEHVRHDHPNTVSRADYDHIAHVYSDIRTGRGDLHIDPAHVTADHNALPETQRGAYRQGALNDIAALLQTPSGRLEVDQLHDNLQHDHHRQTTIVPNLTSAGTVVKDNATVEPTVDDSAHWGAMSSGGTDVNLMYNPGINVWDVDPNRASNPFARTMRSDVNFAHEAVHAMDATAGTLDSSPVLGSDMDRIFGKALRGTHPERPPGFLHDVGHSPVVKHSEHHAVGLGRHANSHYGENPYRRHRAEMARTHAPGVLPGDADMVQRDTYAGWP